jgi:uncharacterized protein (DUF3820 family)
MTGACFRSLDDSAQSPFTDVEQKLIRLGLDKAAYQGESDACAIKLFRALRKRNATADQIIRAFVTSTWEARELAAARGRVMTFGKHQGRTIGELPPSYLRWVLEKCKNAPFNLRRAILLVLNACNHLF